MRNEVMAYRLRRGIDDENFIFLSAFRDEADMALTFLKTTGSGRDGAIKSLRSHRVDPGRP
jgi:hypothetical protein